MKGHEVVPTEYQVDFARIGSHRDIGRFRFAAKHPDALAEDLLTFARLFLTSHNIEVVLDIKKGEGHYQCGETNGGDFKIEALT